MNLNLTRKYDNRYVTSIPFEREVFFKIQELLPKGITIADEINEFLKQHIEDLEDNNINKFNKGPIRRYENDSNNTKKLTVQELHESLNIYDSIVVIKDHINRIDDQSTAWMLKRQAKLIVGIAETRAKKLQKEKCSVVQNEW